MEDYKLLGSDSSLESLKEGIAAFYYQSNSDQITLDEREGYWAVINGNDELDGVRVVKKKGRYRFEGKA